MSVQFLRHYLGALQAFTRIPLRGHLPPGPVDVRACAIHWPGVGLLVGAAAAVVFAASGLLLQGNPFAPLACGALSTLACVALTGALHEEGSMRLAERRGRHGAITLVLMQATKLSLLAVLAAQSPLAVLLALLGAHTLSRLWPLYLLPATHDRLPARMDRRTWAVAIGWCSVPLLIAAAVDLSFAAGGLVLSGLAAWCVHRWLGARGIETESEALDLMQQVGELALYFGCAVGWNLA